MTFTAGNLFLSHLCIAWPKLSHPLGLEHVSPAWEADDLPTELSLLLDPKEMFWRGIYFLQAIFTNVSPTTTTSNDFWVVLDLHGCISREMEPEQKCKWAIELRYWLWPKLYHIVLDMD